MLFFLLIGSVWSQVCSPLNNVADDAVPHNAIVFNDFEGKGGSEGSLFVGGSMRIDQFSAGTLLGSDSEFAIVVAGDIEFQCGDVHNNVLHGGDMTIGPRVSWEGYTNAQVEIGQVYEFSSGHQYFQEISRLLNDVQAERIGAVQRNGQTLLFAGSSLDTEIFNLACADLSGATILEFNSIKHEDTTSIFINVRGEGCVFNAEINSVRGLRWSEPAGHILWNFEGSSLALNGGIIGSVLAPNAHITGVGHILGQFLVESVNATVYLGANLFRGCVPTDTCFLMSQACPDPVMPADCIRPQLIDDEQNPCCKIYSCLDSCDEVTCPDPLVCEGQYEAKKVADSAQNGGFVLGDGESYHLDECCDLFVCLPIDVDACTDQNNDGQSVTSDGSPSSCAMPKPFVHSCPADIVVYITEPGVERIQVDWVPPTFLYTRIVVNSAAPNDLFPVGTTIVSYVAEGLNSVDTVSCYFAIHVNARPVTSGCSFGGINYEQGEWFYNDCALKCLCVSGQATRCTRVRKELLTMDRTERAHYWTVFLAAYHHDDEIVQGYINDHVVFFSRGLHNNGAFLPWHRGYIQDLEDRLRIEDCRTTVPYWDWTINPRASSSNIFGERVDQASGNGGRNRCVETGTFGFQNGFSLTNGRCLQRRISGGATATAASVEQQIFNRFTEASQFDQMRNRLEHGPGLHDSVHCLVGGTMCSARSSNDPVFFSHHANIDCIWSRWQELSNNHKFAYTGNTPIDDLMPVSRYTPRDMLDLENLPSGVRVSYFREDKYIDSILEMFTDEELSNVGFPQMQPVGDEFLFDMNMEEEDMNVIHQAEELANSNAVKEAIAVTLRNGVERGMQMPALEEAIKAVTRRMASDPDNENTITAQKLFESLTRTFRASHLVPRFYELQDIIVVDEFGEVEDLITDFVPIVCAAVNEPVCAQGRTFINECEATQNGFSNVVDGSCLPDPVDVSLSPTVDGGVSDAYNHEVQELSECPDMAPSEGSVCPVASVTCFYGQQCCNLSPITATCTAFRWSLSVVDCELFNNDCTIPEPVEDTDANIVVPSRPPTPSPTRAPTRSTEAPTLSPTRAPTRPTRPARPTRPSVPTTRPTSPIPPRPTRPSLPATRPTSPNSTPRPTRPRPVFVPSRVPTRPIRVSSPAVPSQRPPSIVIPPPVCPVFDESSCPPRPVCCPDGASVERTYIRNSRGEVCGRGCETCMIGRRTVTVPECCRLPVACAMPSCPPPVVPRLVRPAGSNYGSPCCPEYECMSPCSNIVCPTLESTTCPFEHEIPRFSSRMTPEGCCNIIECVFRSCQTDSFVCSSGDVVFRVATTDPPCNFPECPFVCDTSVLYCPAPGNRQIPRERNNANADPPCEWLPCPPYEPCDDDLLNDQNGEKCGSFGQCRRGSSTLICDCEEHYSGARCQTFTEPPRPVFGVHERSFLLTSECVGYMCYDDRCFMSANSGSSWATIQEDLKAILGSFGESLWFVDSDGHAVLFHEDGTTSNREQDVIVQGQMSSDGFVRPTTVFSQRAHVDGVFPPPSEREFIINYEKDLMAADEACAVHVYLTSSFVVFYNSNYMHATSWGSVIHCDDETRDVLCGTIVETQMCENKCLSEDGTEETCMFSGMCVRATGECLCNFGYTGVRCEISTVIEN